MFGFKVKNDYASTSISINNQVKGIVIPVIPLAKYPEIVIRVTSLIEKVSLSLNDSDPQTVLNEMSLGSLLKYIPVIVRIAADELFEFISFVLDIELDKVKKLGLVDMTQIINKVYEVNEFAQVQEDIKNFIKALKTGQGKKK